MTLVPPETAGLFFCTVLLMHLHLNKEERNWFIFAGRLFQPAVKGQSTCSS